MHRRVCRILELRRNEGVRDLLLQLLRTRNRPLHALRPLCQDDLGTVRLKQVATFHAHRLRHRENRTIAACRGDRGDTAARISTCRFDQRRARCDLPLALRLLDHRNCNAILHRARRIEIFQFHHNIRRKIVRLGKGLRRQQRGPSNEFRNRLIDI